MADEQKTVDASLPEELALRDEVRWIKSEDLRLFRSLQESMNKIEPAYVATYPPTECGIATFTRDVLQSVAKYSPFSKPTVIAVKRDNEIEPYDRTVRCQIVKEQRQSYLDAADYVNGSAVDIVSIQHEYGIFGGDDGEYVLDLVAALQKPSVVTCHTVLQHPSPNQKRIIQELGRMCDAMIVMIKTGKQILVDVYGIDPKKVAVIPHGVPNVHRVSASSVKRALGVGADIPIMSTFGLISRGKGIENAIKAMPMILKRHPKTIYLVLGETHPGVRKHEGESYRNSLNDLVANLGLENHVRFNNRFLSLNELVRYLCATDVYITPYLSKDQITSGTLAYALGCGRAIVSTAYLYAEEVLGENRGLLVEFGDPEAIAGAVCRVLDDPALRTELENNAYAYGRRAAWFNVAIDNLELFRRILLRRGQETGA